MLTHTFDLAPHVRRCLERSPAKICFRACLQELRNSLVHDRYYTSNSHGPAVAQTLQAEPNKPENKSEASVRELEPLTIAYNATVLASLLSDLWCFFPLWSFNAFLTAVSSDTESEKRRSVESPGTFISVTVFFLLFEK